MGISMETAQKHLDAWLDAEIAVTNGQSYTIGTRTLTRASLSEIRNQIQYCCRFKLNSSIITNFPK